MPKNGSLAAFGAGILHNEWGHDMAESPVIQYAQTHDNGKRSGKCILAVCGVFETLALMI